VWFRGNCKAPVGGLGDQVPQKLKRYGERGGNSTVTVSHRLLIQCRISCGQSDLTQPEIHMARLYLGANLQFGELSPLSPSPFLATSLAATLTKL